MIPRGDVEAVLDRVRPVLQADGGDIELVEVTNRRAYVRLTGRCAECPSAHLTLYAGVEMAIRESVPDFDGVVMV